MAKRHTDQAFYRIAQRVITAECPVQGNEQVKCNTRKTVRVYGEAFLANKQWYSHVNIEQGDRISKALTLRVGTGADVQTIAEALICVCRDIDAALTPIVGSKGVAALFKRSLNLTIRVYPWFAGADPGTEHPIDLATLKSALMQQSAASALEGASAFVQTFHALLTSLVGAALTERLLFRTLMAEASPDAITKDHTQ